MIIPGLAVKVPAPRLDSLQVDPHRWRHLWLKYVGGARLDVHCARSLPGPYSRLVSPNRPPRPGLLDEFPPPVAYYLCGVTQRPGRWADNAHLAFVYAAGELVDYRSPTGQLAARIVDARQVTFSADDIPEADPHRADPTYATCRNWQFAHRLARGGL